MTAAVDGRLASRTLRELALTGPDGSTLVGLNHSTFGGFPDLWYLPEAGSYRLTVRTDPEHQSGTVRLSTVRELEAEMPADGQALAFTAQKPGEWVLATGQLDRPAVRAVRGGRGRHRVAGVREHPALAAVPWRLLRRWHQCVPFPQVAVQQLLPARGQGRYLFLVTFGPGQTGTVSLRLGPPSCAVVSPRGQRSGA